MNNFAGNRFNRLPVLFTDCLNFFKTKKYNKNKIWYNFKKVKVVCYEKNYSYYAKYSFDYACF